MTTTLTIDLTQPLPLEIFADPRASAIILSLFCDARALPADKQSDPRGWWGDALAANLNDVWGSRLWLLMKRAKAINEILRAAEEYATDALKWMVSDGIASSLSVTASNLGNETMRLAINLGDINYNLEVIQ